jgi:hypothetical protein
MVYCTKFFTLLRLATLNGGNNLREDAMQAKTSNCYQTSPEALLPLLPYIKSINTIWEPAQGKGNITQFLRDQGFQCIGTDLQSGQDFI